MKHQFYGLGYVLACMLVIFNLPIFAQSGVFEKSYGLEGEMKYAEAAKVLKAGTLPDCYECNLRLGWLYYKDNKFDEAVKSYSKAIQLKPMSIEARLGILLPLSTQEKWGDIQAIYKEILKIDPNHSSANYGLGLSYYYQKDYTSADAYFTKVINLYPFDYSTNLMLGWTKYFLGKKQEAEVLFNRVLCYYPTDASALEGLATLKK
ncbi:MAG: tetratricopeptide repeat protein [Bacteroidia bacterium]